MRIGLNDLCFDRQPGSRSASRRIGWLWVVATLACASGSLGWQPAAGPASTAGPAEIAEPAEIVESAARATPTSATRPARPSSLPARAEDLAWWPASERATYAETEAQLLAIPTRGSLLKWHQLLASEPHVAGSVGDERTIARLVTAFEEMGLEVHRHDIWPLLAKPVSAALQIVESEQVELQIKETPAPGDAFSGAADMTFGWNAYSGSGDVTGEVVYANYGTKADFEKLKAMGVDCAGKIVLARYGGNYRGLKAKFAEAAGAAGLIIFTDPGDSGYMKGLVYPEGGYANDCCIQRGSVVTIDRPGDPLTPGVEATEHAQRRDPSDAGLPGIPVQPVGWGAAREIIGRMTGEAVPDGWQGGLPFTYRVTGGPGLKVRVAVQQERQVTRTANVIATLKGARFPSEMVIVGAHHDAWNCGAADPLCGTICVLEAARAFSDMAAKGWRPARTIVFACWGAEEFGIIGSTEWVEGHRQDLLENGVAYLNLDMAVMGPEFGAAATPSLQRVIAEAARRVPQARAQEDESVFDDWVRRSPGAVDGRGPAFGDLGGGSDHVAFNAHAMVPATGFGSGGSRGWSYHSAYDTLPWYWKVVGDDYEPGLMMTRMTSAVIARLAAAPLCPLDPGAALADMPRRLAEMKKSAAGPDSAASREARAAWAAGLDELSARASTLAERIALKQEKMLAEVAAGRVDERVLAAHNRWARGLDRAWMREDGLPGREWNKNLYASTDPDSGYGAWILPGLRAAAAEKSASEIERALAMYAGVLERIDAGLEDESRDQGARQP